MTNRTWSRTAVAIAAGLSLSACGSSSKDEAVVPGPGEVFANSLAPGIDFQAFGGSDLTASSIDTSTGHSGASWRVRVPASGYAGGTFVAATAHDLSTFNAVTFWARASQAATLNVAGFAVDNTPTTPFKTERAAIALTTAWTKFVIPIPAPSRLTAERGLFHFAEGSEEGAYTLWFDDIRYESLAAGEIGTPAPAIATETRPLEIGATLGVNGASVTYPSPGANQTLSAGRRFFDWTSSNTGAATVDADGTVSGVAAGSADITAKLGAVDAAGVTTVNVAAPAAPAVAAPVPAPAPADVISLYSNAYTNAPIAFWSPDWDAAAWEVVVVATDDVMKFSGLGYSVSEFADPRVDATSMTHFHMDVWSPTTGATTVKLVDFGADGAFGGGDDVEHELTVALTAGGWNSLELPLADFTGLTTRAHVAQLVLAGANPTLFVDNVYFHK